MLSSVLIRSTSYTCDSNFRANENRCEFILGRFAKSSSQTAFARRRDINGDLMRFCTRSKFFPMACYFMNNTFKISESFFPLRWNYPHSFPTSCWSSRLNLNGLCRKGKLRDRKWQFNNFTLRNQVNRAELNIFGIFSLSLSFDCLHIFLLSVYLNFDSFRKYINEIRNLEPNLKSRNASCCKIEKFNMNYLWKDWRQRPFRWVSFLDSLSLFHRKKGIGCHLELNLAFWHHFFLHENSAPHLRVGMRMWLWMWM